jgi:hypothetical protein
MLIMAEYVRKQDCFLNPSQTAQWDLCYPLLSIFSTNIYYVYVYIIWIWMLYDIGLVFCVQSSLQQNKKRRPSERRVILQSRQPERSQAVDAEATDQPWLGHCNGFVSPCIWILGFLLFFFSGLKQLQVNDCIYGPINREPNRTLNDSEAYHGVICLPS